MFTLGIDVGGTNTDAVLLDTKTGRIVASVKAPTTSDINHGVHLAIDAVIRRGERQLGSDVKSKVLRCNIGSTHCVNALVQRRSLSGVACVRIGTTSCSALKPGGLMPPDMAAIVCKEIFMDVRGGHNFDGTEYQPLSEDDVVKVAQEIIAKGIKHVAVASPFSPSVPQHELRAREILAEQAKKANAEMFVTLSHEVGGLDLLKRENAAIINAALRPLAAGMCDGLTKAVTAAGLTCDVAITASDGTLFSLEDTEKFPVLTVGSGPTNSMRGAAFLAGVEDEEVLVIDIGGTTTDIGLLQSNGFPRLSNVESVVAGCILNSRMPAVVSVGLGGGSTVDEQHCTVGPTSVGYKIRSEAKVFGGSVLTATDVAVSAGTCTVGDRAAVANLDKTVVQRLMAHMQSTVEQAIHEARPVSGTQIRAVLVGGGTALLDVKANIDGVSSLARPNHAGVANAVGAALASIAAVSDTMQQVDEQNQEGLIAAAHRKVTAALLARGAAEDSIRIVDESVVRVGMLGEGYARVICKGIGSFFDIVPFSGDLVGQDRSSTDTEFLDVSKIDMRTGDDTAPPGVRGAPKVQNDSAASVAKTSVDTNTRFDEVPPNYKKVVTQGGVWKLSHFDLECIALGAGILGCGGGGQTRVGLARAHQALDLGQEFNIVPLDSLPNDAVIVGVGGIGAPMILCERLGSGEEELLALDAIAKASGVKVTHVNSVEIGGVNSILCMLAAAQKGLPIVDADGMGRAFPKLSLYLPFAVSDEAVVAPVAITNSHGTTHVYYGGVDDANAWCAVQKEPTTDASKLEDAVRASIPSLGGVCGIALPPITRDDAQKLLVPNSVSLAHSIGLTILRARQSNVSPVAALTTGGFASVVFEGSISSAPTMSSGEDGFNTGRLSIAGSGPFAGKSCTVHFQNEMLCAQLEGAGSLAQTPDLICLVDAESARPIFVDEIKEGFGLRVTVVQRPIDAKWKEFPRAFEAIQLKNFGLQLP